MQDAPLHADPATFEIVKNSLYTIAEEMRVVLAKTAYSPLLKSAGDYSCGVFDARGFVEVDKNCRAGLPRALGERVELLPAEGSAARRHEAPHDSALGERVEHPAELPDRLELLAVVEELLVARRALVDVDGGVDPLLGEAPVEAHLLTCDTCGDALREVIDPELGVNIGVVRPGEPGCMYHAEDAQEDFLVLSGQAPVEGLAERLGEESLDTGRENCAPVHSRPLPLREIMDEIYARMEKEVGTDQDYQALL